MKTVQYAILFSLPLLAACGSEASKEEEFRTNFMKSCTASAGQSVRPAQAEELCSCSVDKVIEEVGVVVNVPAPMQRRIIDECLTEAGYGQQG